MTEGTGIRGRMRPIPETKDTESGTVIPGRLPTEGRMAIMIPTDRREAWGIPESIPLKYREK